MHTLRATLLLPFLWPLLALAQWPVPQATGHYEFPRPAHFASAADSAAFMQFQQGLQGVGAPCPMDSTIRYRLQWRQSERGGLVLVSRGDGRTLDPSERISVHLFGGGTVCYTSADGRRVVALVDEEPCALICRTVLYYAEDGF